MERGPWIQWREPLLAYQPEARTAIENTIEEECPEMADFFAEGDHLEVVGSERVPMPAGVIAGDTMLELTLRVDSSPQNEFKVRVAMMKNDRFFAQNGGRAQDEPGYRVKVVQWIGVESCFGTDFGLKNR